MARNKEEAWLRGEMGRHDLAQAEVADLHDLVSIALSIFQLFCWNICRCRHLALHPLPPPLSVPSCILLFNGHLLLYLCCACTAPFCFGAEGCCVRAQQCRTET